MTEISNEKIPPKKIKLVGLQETQNYALNGKPVAELTGKEFQKDSMRLTNKVPKYYREKYGGKVESAIGEISLDERGEESDIAHGIGALKAAAFMAVPDVLIKGKLFDWQINWKNRGYDTGVFIAPITIDRKRYIVEVVVERRTNR